MTAGKMCLESYLDLVAGPWVEVSQLCEHLGRLDVDRLPGVVPGVHHDVLVLLAGHVSPPRDVEASWNRPNHLNDRLGWS